MADSILVETEQEKLVALQAIEICRALQQAVKTAPHGHGLATLETVVHDKGFDRLRKMYEPALREHPEAQKGSLFLELRMWQKTPRFPASRPSNC